MRKSKFNLTHLHSTTLDPGYLVPFLMIPTLPNDSFRIGLSTFIRAQPMLAPLMHEVRLFTQYWFVPNRLVWQDWEEFITGGPDLSSTPAFPTVTLTADDAKVGSLTDYFGFPTVEGIEVSALPYRAMAMIWNERYRDEDLQQIVPIDLGSGEDINTSRKLLSPSFSKDYFTTARPYTQRGGDIIVPVVDAPNTGSNSAYDVDFLVFIGSRDDSVTVRLNSSTTPTSLQNPSSSPLNFDYGSVLLGVQQWLKARASDGTLESLVKPAPTSETDLSFEDLALRQAFILGRAVYPTSTVTYYVWVWPTSATKLNLPSPTPDDVNIDVNQGLSFVGVWYNYGTNPTYTYIIPESSGGGVSVGDRICYLRLLTASRYPYAIVPNPLNVLPFSDAPANGNARISYTTSVSGFTVRDLRRSAALQRYAERSLLYGNRYEEFIQREFGIKPRDARIQRPEYLGGGRGILSISEVLQTAESADTGVGTMRGHGVASISQRSIRFRCPEHGIILGLLSIRPKSVYTQGIDREWLKRSRLDFFTPELASIGMQEVLQQELFAQPDNAGQIFGYSQRYQEYRYQKPLVTGEFRDNLSFWNMARVFNNAPELTPEFIDMSYSASDFKRPFQIQDDGAHSFVVMLKNHIRAYRPIPKVAKDILR